MTTTDILKCFREKVCREIEIEALGLDRYVVYTPFMFDDGDHYVVVLRRKDGEWVLTDEGHTMMHLSYTDVDLTQGTRARIIDQVLNSYHVENDAGELRLQIPDEAFGDGLFSYVQALTRITSVAQWTRQRVKSTFWEDFQSVVEEHIPSDRLIFKYNDPQLDPDGNYPIDCYVKGLKVPWHIYAIANDAKCRDATISILYYERAGRKFKSLAIFEDQASVSRRAVAQLSDVVGKQFASLGARNRISEYIKGELLGVAP